MTAQLEPRRLIPDYIALMAATCIGLWAAIAHGVRLIAFVPNFVAILLGGVGFLLTASSPRTQRVLPVIAALAIAATFAAPGLEGVHRWWSLGPVRLNASAAFLPWLFFARGSRTWLALAVFVQVLHVLQPDAAQATAFAVAALPLLATDFVGLLVAALLSGLALVSWTRTDPLHAVDHVERIFGLIAARGAPTVVVAACAGVALLWSGVIAAWSQDARTARLGVAFVLYFVASVATTFVGNFPVPVFGAGAAPILGWWAMRGVLARR